ncbi:MAG: LptF/LptG family permease [Azospirillaceae bacterium]
MINAAHRYILKMLLKTLAATSLISTAVACLIYSQRFVDEIIGQSFSVLVFLEIVISLLPYLLLIAFPVTLCISVIFIYNKLIGDSEILVLRAAGVSQFGLMAPAAWLAVVAMLISYAMTLHFIPQSYQRFKDLATLVYSGQIDVSLPERTFNTVRPGVTVYFDQQLEVGSVADVLVHDNRDPAAPVTVVAERAALSPLGASLELVFWDGTLQTFERANNRVSTVTFDQYILTVDMASAQGASRTLDVVELPMGALIAELADGTADERRWREALVELVQRLISPLLNIAVAVLAIAVLFSGEQVRTSFSRRVFLVSVLVGGMLLLYYWVMALARSSSALVLLMPAIAILPIIGGAIALWHSNNHAPRRNRAPPSQAGEPAAV